MSEPVSKDDFERFAVEVREALTRLTDAITKLARVEERLASQGELLSRIGRQVDRHEERLHVVEVGSALNRQENETSTWFERTAGYFLVGGASSVVTGVLVWVLTAGGGG